MRNNIQLKVRGSLVPFKGFFFSGGEPHVEIQDPETLRNRAVRIEARASCPQDFMMLLALTDAVERCDPEFVDLLLPYFPGARQDREETGYALTVKMYADLINAQGYRKVFVVDPHSPVTPALVERVVVLPITRMVQTFARNLNLVGIIAPDAGAERRTIELARELGTNNVVFGRKKRDPRTGDLAGFSLEPLPTEGPYLVADDLCDGGGTFNGLAAEYRKDPKGIGSLHLWVTHGIFSKGLDELSKRFDHIGCSDSFPGDVIEHPQLQVVKLLSHVNLGGA